MASDDTEQAGLSPWESPDRSATADETQSSSTPSDDEWLGAIRETGPGYPEKANYICNECNDYHTDQLSELRDHIESDHDDVSWSEYVYSTGLHRCAGCGQRLTTLKKLYCEECEFDSRDRVSCRNCGKVRVMISDPFCSAECAGERVPLGDPLSPPDNPPDDWTDHPHRLETGVPSNAPFVENHTYTCRECYGYGSDNLHDLAVHVAEAHSDLGWGGYIKRSEMRSCRVCGDPLESLLPLYCSDECQMNDDDPVRECARDGCSTAVERRQKYCSKQCFVKDVVVDAD